MASDQATRPVILIAERDANVREFQTLFLNRAGYAVEFADDGGMALDRARVLKPALLVTEILIPKLDGLTLCRLVRADPGLYDLPVLVFSILAAGSRAYELELPKKECAQVRALEVNVQAGKQIFKDRIEFASGGCRE